MSKGSGVSRGDRRRNARLAELRLLVSRENAIAGIDLAEDNQALVVTDHDSKVLARRSSYSALMRRRLGRNVARGLG